MKPLYCFLLSLMLAGQAGAQVIDFSGPGCRPCAVLAPTIDKLIAEGLPIRKATSEEFGQYQISQVPTLIVLLDGKEIDRTEGVQSESRIRQMCGEATGDVKHPIAGIIHWLDFKFAGVQNNRGILADVVSHCDAQGKRTASDPDPMTFCHEATHQLNSRIRMSAGGTGNVNAFYVGKDKCVVFKEPHFSSLVLAQYVNRELPNHDTNLFNLYLVHQAKEWSTEPLYILDEESAYANGLQYCRENHVADCQGTDKFAVEFTHYAAAVVQATKDHDPNYPQLAELSEFVDWQRDRIAGMSDAKMTQCCGRCSTGFFGGGYSVTSRPVPGPQPVYQPQPQPVQQPVAPPALAAQPGEKGPVGDQGPVGDKGPVGDQGPAGSTADLTELIANITAQTAAVTELTKQVALLASNNTAKQPAADPNATQSQPVTYDIEPRK